MLMLMKLLRDFQCLTQKPFILAGRLMLERLETLSNSGIEFAFETTLAARYFASFLRKSKLKGYSINLIFFWLQSPELAI